MSTDLSPRHSLNYSPSKSHLPRIAKLALLLLNTVTATACGPDLSKKKNNVDVLPRTTAPSEGVRWLLPEDLECMKNGTSVSVSEIAIFQWNGIETASKRVPFSAGPGQDKEFKSPNVVGSIMNYGINYNCEILNGETSCKRDKTMASDTHEEFGEVRICDKNTRYSRDSIESMTLTSKYFTEAAYQFYDKIPARKAGIKQSILLIQPRIARQITKADGTSVKKYDVDNAAFTSLDSSEDANDRGLFVIYPTALKSFETSKLNLWEVPFVMSHEFGHHVFNHYLGKIIDAMGLSLNRHSSINSILPSPYRNHPRVAPTTSLTTATTKAQLALDGVNETFADLFAYFQGESKPNQLKGVDCMAGSRDPGIANTPAGTSKGLDKASVDIYEGRASPGKQKSCYEPSYDDEHDIALALGQPLARLIEDSTPGADGKSRAQLLLGWATRLETLIKTNASSLTVDSITRELVLTVKAQGKLSFSSCDRLKDKITGLPLASAACAP